MLKPIRQIRKYRSDLVDSAVSGSALAIRNVTGGKVLNLLYLAVGSNILIWLGVLLFPEEVYYGESTLLDVSDKIGIGVLCVPLLIGMAIAYLAFRLKFPDIEEQELESDMMASYAYNNHAQKRWKIVVASAACGAVNLLMLVLTDLALTGQL